MNGRILRSWVAGCSLWAILAGVAVADEVQQLLKQLQDASPQVRGKAATDLGQLGEKAVAAIPALVKAMGDADPTVRVRAIGALRELQVRPDMVIPQLVTALGDADAAVAVAAMRHLADIGPQSVQPVIRVLQDPRRRYWACLVLAELGPASKEALSPLERITEDAENPDIQREAILAIGAIGPEAKSAVPRLIKILQSGDKALVLAAAHALGNIGPGAAESRTALSRAVEGDNPFLQVVAAWSLVKISPEDQAVLAQRLPVIMKGLSDPKNEGVRMAAARVLVDLRPDHKVLVPELEKIVEKGDHENLAHGIHAMASVGKPAVPGMIRLLQYPKIRPAVVRVLAEIGPDAAEATSALAEQLAGSDAAARREILIALGRIGPSAAPAVPAMLARLEDEDERVRFSAVYALGMVGAPARAALPALTKQIAKDDPFLRTVSAWALVRIDPDGPDTARLTLPLLTTALKHERPFVRIEAADALGRLGKRAQSAGPALKETLQDPDPAVREAVQKALDKINS